MLYQLKNGDWIDLKTIRSIQALEQSKDFPDITPRVRVIYIEGPHSNSRLVYFNTIEGARQYRDDLARLAIAAQTEKADQRQG